MHISFRKITKSSALICFQPLGVDQLFCCALIHAVYWKSIPVALCITTEEGNKDNNDSLFLFNTFSQDSLLGLGSHWMNEENDNEINHHFYVNSEMCVNTNLHQLPKWQGVLTIKENQTEIEALWNSIWLYFINNSLLHTFGSCQELLTTCIKYHTSTSKQ